MRWTSTVCVIVAALPAWSYGADEAEKKDEPKPERQIVELKITPAVANRPALKYQLLPTFAERRPGNAAVNYGKAMAHHNPTSEWETKVDEWLKASPESFDRVAKAGDLRQYRSESTMELLRIASRREHCDWDLPIREQMFYSILLPEQQELRKLATLALLESRLAAGGGKFDEAVDHLKIVYALARHNGESPTLINGLVSLAIVARADQVVLDFAQRRGAPSLYAALAFRPRPLVDVRPGLEGEMYSLQFSFPELREAVEAEPDSRDWNKSVSQFIDKLLPLLPLMESNGPSKTWNDFTAALVKIGAVAWTGARKKEVQDYLVSCGLRRDRVEKMSEAQLFLAHGCLFYEDLRDEMFRSITLPYWQAEPQIAAAERRLKKAKGDREELIPLATLLLPAILRVGETHARAERRSDVLQIVEALRLYAGAHDGKLPAKLEDLQTATPTAVVDCVTGKPLDYQLTGDKASLTLTKERGAGTKETLVYEISVAK